MISQDQYDALQKPADPRSVRAFLYVCDDGTQEVLPPEGGEFELLRCEHPRVYALAGGRYTGRRLGDL